MARVAVSPISSSDLPAVGAFLHENLNGRISTADWMRAVQIPWRVIQPPNHGFMLVSEGRVVGVYLAFYSEREMVGRVEKFCNLGAWSVLSKYRLYSLSLLKALLAQDGYHFTDFSPSGNTIPVNERLGFRHLDTTTALLPNLPWRKLAKGTIVTSDRSKLVVRLESAELNIFHDHERAMAAHHVLLAIGDEHCYVIFRRDRRKGMALFASVIYVSNSNLFLRVWRVFASHLLVHYAIPATLLELRLVGEKPAGSLLLKKPRPKMFRSESLSAKQVDNLYSELVCVAW